MLEVGSADKIGDILSTVGNHDAFGRYHEYCGGCSVPWGISSYLSTVG